MSPVDRKLLPVLQVSAQDLAPRALVVGDPKRAEEAARLLQHSHMVGSSREYFTYSGDLEGIPITICSHGVGAAGASVCFTELVQGGVQILIRAGTCGALQSMIDDGSLIIGTAAIREDGTSDRLVPLAYPAFSTPSVIQALQASAELISQPVFSGVVLSQAFLYPGILSTTVPLWQQAGALAVEMELAVLLVIASLNGRQAGGIFTSDGNLARQQQEVSPTTYDPHRQVVQDGIGRMLQVALRALASL